MMFHEKLDKLIKLRRLSQQELANLAGVSQSAISEMTSDKRRPYMDQSLRLAKALNVPLDFLADDELDEIPLERTTEMERYVWITIQKIGAENVLDVLAEALRRIPENSRPRVTITLPKQIEQVASIDGDNLHPKKESVLKKKGISGKPGPSSIAKKAKPGKTIGGK